MRLRRSLGSPSCPRWRRILPLAGIVAVCASAPEARATQIQVEGPQDSLAGAPTINHCTLRKAIINANDDAATYPQCPAGSGADEIVFLSNFTINLTLSGAGEDAALTGDLDITDSLTITGPPGGVVIDGAGLDRIFDINPGNAHPGISVTMTNLTLRNGSGLGGAGCIRVDNATLNLSGVTISGCHAASGDGGAIATSGGGTLSVVNSTISGNTASDHAGAVVVETGSASFTSTTITGNASGFSNLTGGIRALGPVTLRNTIVAGNGGVDLPNLDGTFTSLGYNVIGNLGTSAGNPTIPPTTGDQLGVSAAALNLGPLQNNGGDTPTHALVSPSVAVDKGHSSGTTTDQRGLTRPCNLAAVPNAIGGDGADVGAFELQGTCVSGNSDPEAVDDSVTLAEDTSASVDVLANDSDPDSDPLTVTAVTQGAHGAVVINGGGASVSYTPQADFFGSDSFTYTISDGQGGTDTASVSVTVTNVEDAPHAVNDSATIAEDSGANVINVLANDTDADGDTLSVSAVTQGAHGSVANDGTAVRYTPAANFFGSDSFTYTASDGHGGTSVGTVSVTVTNVNDAPVAAPNSYSVNQDSVLSVAAPGVLGNDTDVDGDVLAALLSSGVSHGLLVLGPTGSITYTPVPHFAGADGFTYRANDGTVDSNVAAVTIAVADTEAPVIHASVVKGLLWPPDHDLEKVGLSVSTTDNASAVTTGIAVFSDEDDVDCGPGGHHGHQWDDRSSGVRPGGHGDHDGDDDHDGHHGHHDCDDVFSPDAKNVAAGTLRLRAERNEHRDGRVYLIIVTAHDASANASHACLTVVVPRSFSPSSLAAVNAQAQAARAYCTATGHAPAGYFVVGDGPVIGPKH